MSFLYESPEGYEDPTIGYDSVVPANYEYEANVGYNYEPTLYSGQVPLEGYDARLTYDRDVAYDDLVFTDQSGDLYVEAQQFNEGETYNEANAYNIGYTYQTAASGGGVSSESAPVKFGGTRDYGFFDRQYSDLNYTYRGLFALVKRDATGSASGSSTATGVRVVTKTATGSGCLLYTSPSPRDS